MMVVWSARVVSTNTASVNFPWTQHDPNSDTEDAWTTNEANNDTHANADSGDGEEVDMQTRMLFPSVHVGSSSASVSSFPQFPPLGHPLSFLSPSPSSVYSPYSHLNPEIPPFHHHSSHIKLQCYAGDSVHHQHLECVRCPRQQRPHHHVHSHYRHRRHSPTRHCFICTGQSSFFICQ